MAEQIEMRSMRVNAWVRHRVFGLQGILAKELFALSSLLIAALNKNRTAGARAPNRVSAGRLATFVAGRPSVLN
jgi:hypothetical protein